MTLPELGIDAVKAKVDTGARSSALHAFDVEVLEWEGLSIVRFKVHPLQRDSRRTVALKAELFDERQVRNPGLTLPTRDAMGFRMLLGRRAVRGKFAIGPGRSFLGGGAERADASSVI